MQRLNLICRVEGIYLPNFEPTSMWWIWKFSSNRSIIGFSFYLGGSVIERVRREIETWGKLSKKMKLGILVKKKDAMRLKKKKQGSSWGKISTYKWGTFWGSRRRGGRQEKKNASLMWDVFWLGGGDALKYTHHVSWQYKSLSCGKGRRRNISLEYFSKIRIKGAGQMVWSLGGAMWSQELDSVFLVGPLHLGVWKAGRNALALFSP